MSRDVSGFDGISFQEPYTCYMYFVEDDFNSIASRWIDQNRITIAKKLGSYGVLIRGISAHFTIDLMKAYEHEIGLHSLFENYEDIEVLNIPKDFAPFLLITNRNPHHIFDKEDNNFCFIPLSGLNNEVEIRETIKTILQCCQYNDFDALEDLAISLFSNKYSGSIQKNNKLYNPKPIFLDLSRDELTHLGLEIENEQLMQLCEKLLLSITENQDLMTADKVDSKINIPPQLLHQLRMILESCAPIDSNEQFRAVFIDSRISIWRNNVPQAGDVATRIDLVIDFLRGRYDDNQQNALVLLLQVLADRIPEGDICKQKLLRLAQELEYHELRINLLDGNTHLPQEGTGFDW